MSGQLPDVQATNPEVSVGLNQGTVDIVGSATAADDGIREEIGIRVTDVTVCPCSQVVTDSAVVA